MSLVLVDSSTQILKTLLGILIGLASIIGGWIIFYANGFYSPVLMLTGTLLMPLGLILFGTGLTGGFGENPRSILNQIRRKRPPACA